MIIIHYVIRHQRLFNLAESRTSLELEKETEQQIERMQ